MVAFAREWIGAEYVVKLRTTDSGVAWSQSDGQLWVSDKELRGTRLVARGTGVSGLSVLDSYVLVTAGMENVTLWDVRTSKSVGNLATGALVTALDVSGHKLALGTAGPDSKVQIIDSRKLEPIVQYTDSHSDDVTDLQWHPNKSEWLVSGSTDGVLNLFDTSIADEDEAVVQAFNAGTSIHRSAFVGPLYDQVLGLSHMETVQLWSLDSNATRSLGDVRDMWGCEYVAGYRNDTFLAGSNTNATLRLVPYAHGHQGLFVELDGAHGNDVVRDFDFANGSVYTAGEDGRVKLWQLQSGDLVEGVGRHLASATVSTPSPDSKEAEPRKRAKGPERKHKHKHKHKHKPY